MTKRDEISEMLNHWLCRGTDSPIDMADRIIACLAEPTEAMVEAVARAIDPEVFTLPKLNLYRPRYDDAFAKARAALAALREPTTKMIIAGGEAQTRSIGSYGEPEVVWWAMIDAAMEE